MGHKDMTHWLFFELLQVALGHRESLSHTPTWEEWKKVMEVAKRQSLVGICFMGAQQLQARKDDAMRLLPIKSYVSWAGLTAKIKKRNELVDEHCLKVQEMIESRGLRCYILKGQGNNLLYGQLAGYRQSGDIDVYIPGGFRKVNEFVQSTYPTRDINELEMEYSCFEDTTVEVHYHPLIMRNPLSNRKLQRYFKAHEEECLAHKCKLENGGEIAIPPRGFNLVHQLAHIHLHLFTEGIGLRQLMDYYFVLLHKAQTTNEQRDEEEAVRMIKNLGLERFAKAVMWVLGEAFGMERKNMLWEPHHEDGELLLCEILKAGNFGKHDEEQNEKKKQKGYSTWALFVRNWRVKRFDRGEWLWGPLWRIYHHAWRKWNGYR